MPRNKSNDFDKKVRAEIAASIDKYLKLRGFTQDKLSDLTGIKQSTLSGYCRATSTPNPGQLQKIALAFNVSISDIDPIRFGSETANPPSAESGNYYSDPQSAKMMQLLHDRPQFRVMFDAAKDLDPESIKKVVEFIQYQRHLEGLDD